MGHALGPFCVSTMSSTGQPRVDSGASHVEKWGDDRHGALVVRAGRRCLVLTIRGTRPSTFDRIARPRAALRRWRRRHVPRPVADGHAMKADR